MAKGLVIRDSLTLIQPSAHTAFLGSFPKVAIITDMENNKVLVWIISGGIFLFLTVVGGVYVMTRADSETPLVADKALNDATLSGVDSDGNGVRDDIDRYITLKYPQSEKMRSSLSQYAKAIEILVIGGGTQASYLKVLNDSLDCLSATFMTNDGDVSGGLHVAAISKEIESLVLNTPERAKSYASSNVLLSGAISQGTSFEDQASRCMAAPSSFPN